MAWGGLNIGNDFKVVDDLVTVSYQSKTGNGSYPDGEATYADAVSVPYVMRSEITKDTTNPLLLRNAIEFDLWTANLSGIVPKKGDLITCNLGVLYVVQSLRDTSWDSNGVQRYHCNCLQSPEAG